MNSIRKAVAGSALVAVTIAGGALGASFANGTAGAATNPTASTTVQPSTGGGAQPPAGDHGPGGFDPSKGGHTANGITEKLLTGTADTQARAAALKAVPGGTIQRVENDAEGATYEAHMTKADGSAVTVKMDASFNVTKVEQGM